jgi:hypothetical protein
MRLTPVLALGQGQSCKRLSEHADFTPNSATFSYSIFHILGKESCWLTKRRVDKIQVTFDVNFRPTSEPTPVSDLTSATIQNASKRSLSPASLRRTRGFMQGKSPSCVRLRGELKQGNLTEWKGSIHLTS